MFSAILPLIGVDKTAVLGISTPSDDGNYYTVLLNSKKENGDSVFRTIPVGLACDDCRNAGRPADCPHKASELPPWKPADRHEIQKAMMPAEQFAAETLGLIPGKSNIAFTRADILKLMNSPHQDVHVAGRSYVYIACDPTAGRESRLALAAFMWAHSDADDRPPPLPSMPQPQLPQVLGSALPPDHRPAEESAHVVVRALLHTRRAPSPQTSAR